MRTPHAALLRHMPYRLHSWSQSARPQQVLQSRQLFFLQISNSGEVDSGVVGLFIQVLAASRTHYSTRILVIYLFTANYFYRHLCMKHRGIKENNAKMKTIIKKGYFLLIRCFWIKSRSCLRIFIFIMNLLF